MPNATSGQDRQLREDLDWLSLPTGYVGCCGECGMPLKSWDEQHTVNDCEWWKATQPIRDALVGLGRLQREINEIVRQA